MKIKQNNHLIIIQQAKKLKTSTIYTYYTNTTYKKTSFTPKQPPPVPNTIYTIYTFVRLWIVLYDPSKRHANDVQGFCIF